MKKNLAIILACATVLANGATAFAADTTTYYCGYTTDHKHSEEKCYTTTNTCGKEAHTHGVDCSCLETEHTHGTNCNTAKCGKTEHKHGLDCQYSSTDVEHAHGANCSTAKCGKTEHSLHVNDSTCVLKCDTPVHSEHNVNCCQNPTHKADDSTHENTPYNEACSLAVGDEIHTHSLIDDKCYSDELHTHNQTPGACCDIVEHTHNNNSDTPCCTLDEHTHNVVTGECCATKEHTHSDACCTKTSHAHTDTCSKTELTCKDHVHDLSCTVTVSDADETVKHLYVYSTGYTFDEEEMKMYIPLFTDSAKTIYANDEAIWDAKLYVKVTDGKEYIKDYYFDDLDECGKYPKGANGIVIDLNDYNEVGKTTIEFEIKITGKNSKTLLKYDDAKFRLKFNNTSSGKFLEATKSNSAIDFDDDEVTIDLLELNSDTYSSYISRVVNFNKEIDLIMLEADEFYYEVKASDQGKLSLLYDTKANKTVARNADSDADLHFFNFYGEPSFDFTGTVTITLPDEDEEWYLYQINDDNTLRRVSSARLNDDDDAYEFKTRTLGCYVLSDMKLDTSNGKDDVTGDSNGGSNGGSSTDKPVEDNVKDNPATGC